MDGAGKKKIQTFGLWLGGSVREEVKRREKEVVCGESFIHPG